MKARPAVRFGLPLVAVALIASLIAVTVAAGPSESSIRARLPFVARDEPAPAATPPPGSTLPPLPPGWPEAFSIGVSGGLGTASGDAARGVTFRYQYLAGGVNTGTGWSTWNPDGTFVSNYVAEAMSHGIIPVFPYYQIRQSNPGVAMDEGKGVAANLTSQATMDAYLADLDLFFRRAATSKSPVVLHFEPDLWGFIQQRSKDDDASTVPVAGVQTAAGLAGRIVELRDRLAPNVLLAYHLSFWGTGEDPLYSKLSTDRALGLVTRAVAFYESLNARFDLVFAEFTDRDAGFKRVVYGDKGASSWDEDDFQRNIVMLGAFSHATGLRFVMWQIPFGNTRMRAVNDTWGHFQDNKVERLLESPVPSPLLRAYLDAGLIALLFGGGAAGTTCGCDAMNDGVTNPAPVNGNDRESVSADDDGGYFGERAAALRDAPPLLLPR